MTNADSDPLTGPDSPHNVDNSHIWLAAIVDNSFDAILSKTLDGIITSWNAGAERLLGYSSDEAIGQPIKMIIPDDRLHEEAEILARLRRGERIDRFDTVRRAKDGTLADVELTISPVRDAQGRIIGASKIVRDISERRRQAEAQQLILREMDHRIKNLLSIVQSLVQFSRRHAETVDDFAADFSDRLSALTAAHDLILTKASTAKEENDTTLVAVLQAILAPYLDVERVEITVPDHPIGRRALTSLALIFHELATNAVKYGGLSVDTGRVAITAQRDGPHLMLEWREVGGQQPDEGHKGYGTELLEATLRGLNGTFQRAWESESLVLRLRFPCGKLEV